MHTYVLRNSQDRIIEVKSGDSLIVSLAPNECICFCSMFDDLEPLFDLAGVDYQLESTVEIDPDFIRKCQEVRVENFSWKEEGF